MSDQFLGEIRMFAGNFAPTGWAICNGALLPISQNTALFAILGNFYGGDGKSTYALPNLQGATPISQGQGPGLTARLVGDSGGAARVTLLQSEIPQHTHTLRATSAAATTNSPDGNVFAATDQPHYRAAATSNLNADALAMAGGSLPHNNMQPSLGITFIIALQGIFPPRGQG